MQIAPLSAMQASAPPPSQLDSENWKRPHEKEAHRCFNYANIRNFAHEKDNETSVM